MQHVHIKQQIAQWNKKNTCVRLTEKKILQTDYNLTVYFIYKR